MARWRPPVPVRPPRTSSPGTVRALRRHPCRDGRPSGTVPVGNGPRVCSGANGTGRSFGSWTVDRSGNRRECSTGLRAYPGRTGGARGAGRQRTAWVRGASPVDRVPSTRGASVRPRRELPGRPSARDSRTPIRGCGHPRMGASASRVGRPRPAPKTPGTSERQETLPSRVEPRADHGGRRERLRTLRRGGGSAGGRRT